MDKVNLILGVYNAEFQNAVGATYDKNGVPSCHNNKAPSLRLPGTLKLVSGQLTVKNSMNLVGNTEALLTLKKDSFLIGTVGTLFLVKENCNQFLGL